MNIENEKSINNILW